METEGLIKRAKQGDKDALVRLIMDNKQDYYRLSYSYMGNQEDALDAMEDMIVILYREIHRLKKEEAFLSWSKTILVNSCKGILRKQKKLLPMENMDELSYDYTSHSEEKIMLSKCMSRLSTEHQDVLKLRYYMDMDYNSISVMLRIPVGTVKSRISIALKKLREYMGGECFE